jgi:hypothetical protein
LVAVNSHDIHNILKCLPSLARDTNVAIGIDFQNLLNSGKERAIFEDSIKQELAQYLNVIVVFSV